MVKKPFHIFKFMISYNLRVSLSCRDEDVILWAKHFLRGNVVFFLCGCCSHETFRRLNLQVSDTCFIFHTTYVYKHVKYIQAVVFNMFGDVGMDSYFPYKSVRVIYLMLIRHLKGYVFGSLFSLVRWLVG